MNETNPPDAPCAWIFQANPAQYDLSSELSEASPGDTDWWNASQHRARMRPGDVVLLWASGKRAGIYAVAVLTSTPFQHEDDREQEAALKPYELVSWRVEYQLLAIFAPELSKAALRASAPLVNLSILRSPQGTNFIVDALLWPTLREVLLDKLARGEGRGALEALPKIIGDRRAGTSAVQAAKQPASGVDEARADANPHDADDDRNYGLWPLPGGVREYKNTLDAILRWLGAAERTVDSLRELLRDQYGAYGKTSINGYLRQVLSLGLAEHRGAYAVLTDEGRAYLMHARASELFERFEARYRGMLDTLALAARAEGCTTASALPALNERLGTSWRSNNQPSFRRNWLLSMGLTERLDDVDRATAAGREALRAHGIETHDGASTATPTEAVPHDPAPEEQEPGLSPGEPAGWRAQRLALDGDRIASHLNDLVLQPTLLAQIAAALSTGKHLLLIGPPGTGKTELAGAIAAAARAEGYCHGLLTTTASADWSTFETIGGYALAQDGSLRFRAGVFLRAVESHRWLLIDEFNRADVDRAFGELLTVLAGRGAETPFLSADGRPITLGFEETDSHFVAPSFRVIATMNTWDKSSLFRLSYALLRRFAIVPVEPPDDVTFQKLIAQHAGRTELDPPIDDHLTSKVQTLFSRNGLLRDRALGPALALDIVRYLRRRQGGHEGLAEAIAIFLLPQLDALDADASRRVSAALLQSVEGALSQPVQSWLKARLDEALGTRT